MKKLAYVAGLFALTCAPLLAALYEGLEVGMDKDQVLKTLRRSKQLEGPPTDALLARTGLNGVFKTRQAIGGQTFALGHGVVSQLYTVIIVITIHSIITAHYRSDLTYTDFLHFFI